ncbi:hypothetical protein IKF63_02235 [Candidatus Saccharibacteria bacterium]|nr:hypothetical protein [Candidatus Saccharibacteria bacterium]
MKIFSLIKIGHRHIAAHKRQSFLSIATIGILFGALLSIVFLFEGTENIFIKTSNKLSNNKLYVTTSSCNKTGKCLDWEAMEQLTKKKIADYNGEIVGKIQNYEYKNGSLFFSVIDEEYVENLIEINLAEFPKGTLFKIITLDEADELVNGTKDESSYVTPQKTYSLSEINDIKSKTLGKEFIETFTVPSSRNSISEILEDESQIAEFFEQEYEKKTLNYVVAGVVGSTNTSTSLSQGYSDIRILDLFLDRVEDQVAIADLYIARKNDNTMNFKETFEASDRNSANPIVKFSNLDDASKFYSNESCDLEQNFNKCSNFTVKEIVGNRLQTKNALRNVYYIFNYDEIALLLIALTISVFTFIRLVGENARSIALYRSLGASSFDILVIYFSYLLELCLFTVIFSVILGGGIALVISLKDATLLSDMLTSIYGRAVSSGILIGFSLQAYSIIAAILLTAPLCSILTLDQLSTKNIAKKIKN